MTLLAHDLDYNVFTSRRVIRFMVRHVKYFLGLRFQVSGWEHLQTDGPYVIISNHQSSLDVLGERIHTTNQHLVCSVLLLLPRLPIKTWLGWKSGIKAFYMHTKIVLVSFCTDCLFISAGMMEVLPDRCSTIAKKELLWAGTVGMICWLGGIVFINRKKTSDAKNVMSDAAKTMLADKVCLCWDQIVVYLTIHSVWFIR